MRDLFTMRDSAHFSASAVAQVASYPYPWFLVKEAFGLLPTKSLANFKYSDAVYMYEENNDSSWHCVILLKGASQEEIHRSNLKHEWIRHYKRKH